VRHLNGKKILAATKRCTLFITSQLMEFYVFLCVYLSFVSLIHTQASLLEAFPPVMY